MGNLLEVRNLVKDFGPLRAVDGVDLTVEEGQIFGLLGPNGAGKSTFLSMICGVLQASQGTIVAGGWDIKRYPAKAKGIIGIVPQEPALYPQLSARANLRFWGKINGLRGAELDKAVDNVLRIAGLEDRAKDRVGKYSGGMKRRLNIAAGLIHNPRLLIMDEPTVGVDPQSRSHILETVLNLKKKGTTVIYTSHYVEEVESICDKVAIMDHGRIIAEGDVAALLSETGEYQELVIKLKGPAGHSPEDLLSLAFEAVIKQDYTVSEIKIDKPTLESLFLKLTGRALRD